MWLTGAWEGVTAREGVLINDLLGQSPGGQAGSSCWVTQGGGCLKLRRTLVVAVGRPGATQEPEGGCT